jgi:2-haloacid dehalogenase
MVGAERFRSPRVSQITTLVFDVGNVLIRWEPTRLYGRLFPDPARCDWFLTEICSEAWNR